jgi:hypothetical protein
VRQGHFEKDTVYLVSRARWRELRPFADRLACGLLDRHLACVLASNEDPFRSALTGR